MKAGIGLEKVLIRASRISDRDTVVEIVFSSLRAFGIEPDPERWERHIVNFGSNPPSVKEFVLSQAGTPVGVAVVQTAEHGIAKLSDFYIEASCRGKGHGRDLLAHAVAWAKAQGVSKLELEARTEFEAAIHLYETTGWQRGPDLPKVEGPREGPDRTYTLDLSQVCAT